MLYYIHYTIHSIYPIYTIIHILYTLYTIHYTTPSPQFFAALHMVKNFAMSSMR